MLLSWLLLAMPASSCNLPQDYRTVMGGENNGVELAYSAPNDLGDLVVAGTYYTIQKVPHGYVYLWQESDCSYLWKYQFDTIKHLYAVSWSYDQRSAIYVLGYD